MEAPKWKHIDTAPKDGNLILAANLTQVRVVRFNRDRPTAPWDENGHQGPPFDPKYWMEIPHLSNSDWNRYNVHAWPKP